MSDTPRTDAAMLEVQDTHDVEGPKAAWSLVWERFRETERAMNDVTQQLETERLRLAACGTAALGYFIDCADAFKSASLDDVLALRKRERDVSAYAEKQRLALRDIMGRLIPLPITPGTPLSEADCKGIEEALAIFNALPSGPTAPLAIFCDAPKGEK